jgi:4'-phosphopantetheinyl transferase
VHRDRFIVARGILRSILGRYLSVPPERLSFTYGESGKPALAQRELTFNLSHSDDHAMYAFALDRAVGIDIEVARSLQDAERISRAICSPRELDVLTNADHSERDTMLLTYWTCKEAFVKARGDGLAFRLPDLEIDITTPPGPRLVTVAGHPKEAARWRLERLLPDAGVPRAESRALIGALVVEGHDWTLAHATF